MDKDVKIALILAVATVLVAAMMFGSLVYSGRANMLKRCELEAKAAALEILQARP